MSFEIGKSLETQEPFCLKIKDVVASRTYMASETRFGKSHTARRIIEECYGHVGMIIIDPEGEYSSLREKFAFIIIGRDIPIEAETLTLRSEIAEFMAQQILETKSSAIIDLSVIEDPEQGKEFVDAFLRRFFHLQTTAKQPYLLVWEEAEDFAPESGAPGTRTCLETAIAYARRGGKRGIGVIFVGHRPAWISKGILSQCPNKAIGRIESPDMKALEEYARIPHSIVEKLVPKTDEEGTTVYAGPNRGVFCFTGDWVQKTTFVKVGPVKTTHLGSTPEIIPPSPKEIRTVIEDLKKALPEAIRKIKPPSTAEVETKIKNELETKYKDKINAILKTAEEKAERKFKVKIDELQIQLDKLSRTQALQPVAPITDALEHPIVKARMLQLDDRSRDLLMWVEREPGHTREELAARMITSKDAVANVVDKINKVFQLEVIVADKGRPLRYRSMLKRLFLTDVARKEIDELKRLQERNSTLEEECKILRPAAQQSAALRSEVQRLTNEKAKLVEDLGRKTTEYTSLKAHADTLAKENAAFQKIKEGFAALGMSTPTSVDEAKLKTLIDERMKEALAQTPHEVVAEVDQKGIAAIVKQEISTQLSQLGSGGVIPTSIELEHKVTHFDVKKPEEHVKADTTTLPGRIIFLITKGLLDQRQRVRDIVIQLSNNGWVYDNDKEVEQTLIELCGKGIFSRKVSTGNYMWYSLQPEAKQLIHD